MNTENQHTEYKETWRDEYMKTLAAFANSDGGSLFIGIDDSGKEVGLENAAYLLENLPNKIIQKLNIFPEVNQIQKGVTSIIEIKVGKYDNPVSFNGKYYIRAGSTTQELADKELHRFLLQKSKISWESLIEEDATIDEIKETTVARFKQFAKKRVPGIENENTVSVLKKLNLLNSKGQLKRAAILLFGNDVRKYFMSAYFKIGKFQTETALVTDDVIEGNLFEQLEQVMQVLRGKYIRLIVREYKDWRRIEEFEYPEDALREAIINALIHKDYSGSHIQMKVYDDKIVLWNPGKLLEGITLSELKTSHHSVQRNELLCEAFYRADFIEAWGRGTIKIVDLCKAANLPEPEYEENSGGIRTIFYKDKYNENSYENLGLNERQIKALEYLKENRKITSKEYCILFDITKRTANRDIKVLINLNLVSSIGLNKNIEFVLVE
jgi:ATP-dependent DNA helicase RecG